MTIPAGAAFALAVDGGGTGCRAVMVDVAGLVVGHVTGGPTNMTSDSHSAIANLRALVASVLGDVAPKQVSAHFGLAGVISADMGDRVNAAFDFARCTVSDDRVCFVKGALGDRDGVLLALGTGSVMASQFAGKVRGINGWGWQLSDHGSGAWLGRALLERALLCHDGFHPQSDLTRAVLADMGGPTGIIEFAAGAKAPEYAAFAPRLAGCRDANARAIMTQGAEILNRAVDLLDPAGAGVLCLAGGVGPHYAEWLRADLRTRLAAPFGSALDGALTLARAPG